MKFCTSPIALLLLVFAPASHAESGSLNPLRWFTPNDAGSYASKMAATIKDTPECRKYKDAIMAHSNGKTTSGKDMHPIAEARRKAAEAGCSK